MTSQRYLILFLVAAVCCAPLGALAAKGVVAYKASGCDYYIVETSLGFVLLEWYGGNDPSRGDVLVGDYESYGMKKIFNVTSDSETSVWVEDFWLSQSSVVEKYKSKCQLK